MILIDCLSLFSSLSLNLYLTCEHGRLYFSQRFVRIADQVGLGACMDWLPLRTSAHSSNSRNNKKHSRSQDNMPRGAG